MNSSFSGKKSKPIHEDLQLLGKELRDFKKETSAKLDNLSLQMNQLMKILKPQKTKKNIPSDIYENESSVEST